MGTAVYSGDRLCSAFSGCCPVFMTSLGACRGQDDLMMM